MCVGLVAAAPSSPPTTGSTFHIKRKQILSVDIYGWTTLFCFRPDWLLARVQFISVANAPHVAPWMEQKSPASLNNQQKQICRTERYVTNVQRLVDVVPSCQGSLSLKWQCVPLEGAAELNLKNCTRGFALCILLSTPVPLSVASPQTQLDQ